MILWQHKPQNYLKQERILEIISTADFGNLDWEKSFRFRIIATDEILF